MKRGLWALVALSFALSVQAHDDSLPIVRLHEIRAGHYVLALTNPGAPLADTEVPGFPDHVIVDESVEQHHFPFTTHQRWRFASPKGLSATDRFSIPPPIQAALVVITRIDAPKVQRFLVAARGKPLSFTLQEVQGPAAEPIAATFEFRGVMCAIVVLMALGMAMAGASRPRIAVVLSLGWMVWVIPIPSAARGDMTTSTGIAMIPTSTTPALEREPARSPIAIDMVVTPRALHLQAIISVEELSVIPDLHSASAWFTLQSPLLINGHSVAPGRAFATWLTADTYGITENEDQSIPGNTLGLTLVYPVENPRSVSWSSGAITDPSRMSVTMADPLGRTHLSITPANARVMTSPMITWTDRDHTLRETPITPLPSTVPWNAPLLGMVILGVMSLLLVIKPRVGQTFGRFAAPIALIATLLVPTTLERPAKSTDYQPDLIISHLLQGIYQALELVDESAIYDQLVTYTADPVAELIYLEHRRALVDQERTGAQVTLENITLINWEGSGNTYTIRWLVTGTINHYGHRHLRANMYRATISIEAQGGQWRIHELDITENKRM